MAEQAKTTNPKTDETTALTDGQKWLIGGVCLLAAVGIRYVGLLAMWPRDPDLPVALLACNWPALAAVEMMALAAVAAALVAVAVGRQLPGSGVVAVALGLLLLGWGHGDWRLVIAHVQAISHDSWPLMHTRLLGETIAWTGVILAALMAACVAREWIAVDPSEAKAGRTAVVYSRTSEWLRRIVKSREQWLMLIASGLAGIVLVEVLYAANVGANVGQGYFIALGAMFLAVLLGHQVFSVKVIWPAALAWVVPAVTGHIWALMGQDLLKQWWLQGINPLADMLPLQYAAGGTLGGILGLWASHKMLRWREEQQG